MKKSFYLFIIIGLAFCQNPESSQVKKGIVKIDKAKAMDHWDKATSSLQFSDYHRIHYDSAALYFPDSSEIIQRYSYSYKKTGEHITAMQLLDQAVELDPKGSLDYRAWSMLYFYRHYEKAIADIDALLQLTNSCMEVCWAEPCKYHRFLALYKLRKYEAALEEIAELKQCEKEYGFSVEDNYNYNFYTARCYYELQNYEEALQYFDKLFIKEAGIVAEYLYYKGLTLLAIEEKENACAFLQAAHQQALKGNTFSDPYFDPFDKVYLWMVEEKMELNCSDKFN